MHSILRILLPLGLLPFWVGTATGTPALGPWTPLYRGVEMAQGTNIPGGSMPNSHVVYVIRVDLADPTVRLFSSPRLEQGYAANAAETGGYTVTDFLAKHRLQVAVNAGLFNPEQYYLPAGTPMDISGLSVCEGVVVSPANGPDNAATIAFSQDNVPRIIPTNWPAASEEGMYTAVSGSYPLLVNGVNLGAQYLNDRDFIHRTNPRTVMGYSLEPRRLFIVVIDGRQPGYSTGANDYESAAWLAFLGATEGINLDGGGSSTLTVEDSTGEPRRLNRPSAVADSGRERTVGNHFGVFAQPLEGFFKDLTVVAEDVYATVTWTTPAAADGAVRFGIDRGNLARVESPDPASTDHRVVLTGLAPGTRYYYSAVSRQDGVEQASSLRTFVTANHVTEGSLFGVDQGWRYAGGDLDGVAWTAPGFDDSGWSGPGPGLLWVDGRGSPRNGVTPAATQLPLDSSGSGFPFVTYYFRTHFEFPADPAGATLRLTTYLDDGAVFFLNGVEVRRFRMPEAPEVIAHDTLADGFGCDGDATCGEELILSGDAVASLRRGDNVLAVEVHNYNARSPDATFGLKADYTVPVPVAPVLEIQRAEDGAVRLRWLRPGFLLESAPDAVGPWTVVQASGTALEHTVSASPGEGARFYRLRSP